MIGVHAISMIYTLRSISTRLHHILARNEATLMSLDQDDMLNVLALVDLLIRRIEHVPSHIADPEAWPLPAQEAGVGSVDERGDLYPGYGRI